MTIPLSSNGQFFAFPARLCVDELLVVIAIPAFGDGKLIGAGLFFKNDKPLSSNELFFAFPARLYVD